MNIDYLNGTQSRRNFMQLAAWAVGGTLAAQPLAALAQHDHHNMISEFPALADYKGGYFDADTKAIVERVAEMILPRTDTPGALDANVPAFLELMVEQWMRDDERARWQEGIDYLKGQEFVMAKREDQQNMLGHLEAEASDSGWYQLGTIMGPTMMDNIPFICQIKELTVCGFMLSEVGANEFLSYNHMAGALEGDIPLEDGQPSWAAALDNLG